MIIKNYKDIPKVTIVRDGFHGVSTYFCLTKDDGCPHYALRVIEFEPYGYTSFHDHPEEHEIFFLEGSQFMLIKEGRRLN